MDSVTFSWTAEETTSVKQAAARVIVSESRDFSEIAYDSGEKEDLNSAACTIPLQLAPRTRYFWKVWVKGDANDEVWSEPAWFETSKMDEPWQARWAQSPLGGQIHPLAQYNFELAAPVRSARAYVCGLGLYELYINGEKAGDEVLAPFYTGYDNWTQYQTYDVATLLKKGGNALGVIFGNGWYKGAFGFDGGGKDLYGDNFALLFELRMTFTDGSERVIAPNEQWLFAESPITDSGIYLGEHFDANKSVRGFATVSCDTSSFVPAKLPETSPSPAVPPLTARLSPPLRIIEKFKPQTLIHTPKGETVLDLGQIISGWVEFTADLPKGKVLYLQHAELLQKGNFYTDNLRGAKQEYRYISDGEKRRVHPCFTFYGFRYVKVEGLDTVNPEDFTACVIHSDLAFTGKITVANPKVQKLIDNALWSQRGNFLDVPTDCPQRDERMGWTGDAQVFAATACFNMESAAFFNKYLYEISLEQKLCGGAVPHVAPNILRMLSNALSQELKPYASCAWGDAATVIPWTLYLFYGDKAMLARHYPGMKMWVDYIREQDRSSGDSRLWRTGFHFADWLALDNPDADSTFGRTDPFYVASCYYLYSAGLTAKAARVLGHEAQAVEYETLAGQVREAIRKEYFTATGRLAIDTQTAHVLALFMDVAPEFRGRLISDFAALINARKNHLDTGFVGTAYLCKTLSEHGLNELAYTLLLNEDYPSWLYEVNLGATTIWERWNSLLPDGTISGTGMNSMNHYAYGAVVEWIYRCLCGINPAEAGPGFAKARIAPMPDKRLPAAEAEYRSAKGTYRSGWKKTEGGYCFEIEVPFDAEAEFVLPGKPHSVIIDGESRATEGRVKFYSGTHVVCAEYGEEDGTFGPEA
jgi:alpha-L-rhamnosidase